MKYTCLLFGEGGRDKYFLMSLSDLSKFKYHTKKWEVTCDGASGCSPEIILDRCIKLCAERSYDLILCFIDLDQLKRECLQARKKWETAKKNLENKYSQFTIIWQIDNAEDEIKKVLGAMNCSKRRLNHVATKRIAEFINSDLWNRIMKPIKNKEEELEAVNHIY